jgi:hypothetical protein
MPVCNDPTISENAECVGTVCGLLDQYGSLYYPLDASACPDTVWCYGSGNYTTAAQCATTCSAAFFTCSGTDPQCASLSPEQCRSSPSCNFTTYQREDPLTTPELRAACLQSGFCSDIIWFQTTDLNSPVCQTNWLIEHESFQYCADNQTVSPTGCFDLYFSTCAGEIRYPALSNTSCLAPTLCQIDLPSNLQGSACTSCYGYTTPAFSWIPNYVLEPLPFELIERQIIQPNYWSTGLDFLDLSASLLQPIFLPLDNALRSQVLCQYAGLQEIMSTFVCDCSALSSGQNCFRQSVVPSAITYPCPDTNHTFHSGSFDFYFSDTSIDPLLYTCPAFPLRTKSALQFRQPKHQGTPTLFDRHYPVRDYQVSNDGHLDIGQVRGNALTILPPSQNSAGQLVATNVTICIDLRTDLGPLRNPHFVIPDLGRVVSQTWDVYPRMLANATLVITAAGAEICALVPQVYYGDWFLPILRLADVNAPDDELYDTTDLGIIYTSSALYFLVLIFCVYRFIQLFIYHLWYSLRIFNPICLGVFDTFRFIYFLILGLGVLADASSWLTFILVDIPYFFWFLGMTMLLWWWVALAYTHDKNNLTRNFFILVALSSALILGLLVIIGILYGISESQYSAICGGRLPISSQGLSTQNVILIVYKSILAAFSIFLSVLFLFTGQKLKKIATGRLETRIILITWISIGSFVGQSIYFVFLAAFSGNGSFTNSVYSLIPLWFIEIVPQVLMLALQSPEKNAPNVHRKRTYSRTESTSGISMDSMSSDRATQPRVVS